MLQFVAFLAAWRDAAPFDPIIAGSLRLLWPEPSSLDAAALLFAAAALALLAWRGWGMLAVLGLAVGAGVALSLSGA